MLATNLSAPVSKSGSFLSLVTSASRATSDVTRTLVTASAGERPYDDFVEVTIADYIDRIYVPFLVIVGLVFNSLCFVTFVTTSLRSTSTCIYMAAVAVLDSVVLVHALCVLIRRYIGQTVFYLGSDWTCGFQFFLFYFTIHMDVLVLLAMTVDRFLVVTFPLKAQSWSTPRSAVRVIAGVGIFSFALNFQIFFNRRLVPSGNSEDPFRCWYPAGDIKNFMEKVYTVIDSTLYSFVPFVSLLTLNLLIIRQLRQARRFSKQFTEKTPSKARGAELKTENLSSGKMDGDRESGTARKPTSGSNTNVMFLLVSFTFLLLTSPIVIVLLYGRHYWQPRTSSQRAQFRLALACVDNIMYTNHAINFLLYCLSGQRFRQELGRMLARCCWRRS